MKDIIQKLKDNEKPFGLMSEEMQAKAREIEFPNFLAFRCQGDGFWEEVIPGGFFSASCTYRLREDYSEPEAGVVDVLSEPWEEFDRMTATEQLQRKMDELIALVRTDKRE